MCLFWDHNSQHFGVGRFVPTVSSKVINAIKSLNSLYAVRPLSPLPDCYSIQNMATVELILHLSSGHF